MQEALQEAEKYASRCEALAARMEEGKGVLKRAQAEQAERARAAAEEAEAAAAVAAAERLRMERQAAELTSRMQSDAMRLQQMQAQMQSDAILLQQVQAQLGVAPPTAPAVEEEALCVVCMDAPKLHIILPCGHQCVCEACAQQLTQTTSPSCPVCRTPIRETTRVYK